MNVNLGLIFCTCPRALADELARELASQELAICVTTFPVSWSRSAWETHPHLDDNALMVITAAEECIDAAYGLILDAHPSTRTPVVTVPIDSSYEGYIEWMESKLA